MYEIVRDIMLCGYLILSLILITLWCIAFPGIWRDIVKENEKRNEKK